MYKHREIELKKIIAQIEYKYPQDNLILTYKDFLKERDYLQFNQFNPIVFLCLIKLTNDEWSTKKRINRLSLLEKIKQYFHVAIQDQVKLPFDRVNETSYQFSTETKKQLFELFRKTFDESIYISKKQIEEARRISSNILRNIELTETEVKWLCDNVEKSKVVLNRILRYPVKSKIISKWVKENFNKDFAKNRRAEFISWIIDEEPKFEIDKHTLIDDFDYLNEIDIKNIQEYERTHKEIENLNNIKQEIDIFDLNYNHNSVKFEYIPSNPKLTISKRFYDVPIDEIKERELDIKDYFQVHIPDFSKMRKQFYDELDFIQKITMIWAIGYSRLDNNIKTELLVKYYCKEIHQSFIKVCKKTKNTDAIKWIINNYQG